ncbi:MAG: aminoacyl-tRNA hydrolase [Zetaproteobacteria bacterium]|nr:MAG: aminoacyl-tRNA hydrolase [Zetaproteobacteria bacterium]
MKLLVGLGNPGRQYARQRHNVGFRFVDCLAGKEALAFSSVPRFHAELAEWVCEDWKVLLVKPQTFMNRSGEAVGILARYYDLGTEDIIVVYDDLDLAPGKVRLRRGGGHGGHNGLRSLNQHLPDAGYTRVRLGIGRPPAGRDVTSWVLGNITAEEKAREAKVFEAILEVLPRILAGDLAGASNCIHLKLQET